MTISNTSPERAVEQVILPALRDLADEFKVRRALPSVQRLMVGPFILLDHFGPLAFRVGAGLDMPPHPHIFSGILPNPCYTHYNVEFDIEVLACSALPLYTQSLPRCIQR